MSFSMIQSKPFVIPLENDFEIRGDIHAPREEGKRPVVIICHGYQGFKDLGFFPFLADELAENGFYAIRFNFSSNGVSANSDEIDEPDKFAINTYTRELDDLAVLFEKVKTRQLPFSENFDLDAIGTVGHSRGAAISILFAAENPEFNAVVSWNGVAVVNYWGADFKKKVLEEGIGYVKNIRTKERMPLKAVVFEDMDENEERFNILEKMKTMKVPVLLVQGDSDSDWQMNGAKKMEAAAPHHSLVIIKGGNHIFNITEPLFEPPVQLEDAINETITYLKRQFN